MNIFPTFIDSSSSINMHNSSKKTGDHTFDNVLAEANINNISTNSSLFSSSINENSANTVTKNFSKDELQLISGKTIGFTYDYGNRNSSYAMVASLNTSSTETNPIVNVSIQNSDGSYSVQTIRINNINTRNATESEIFALCSYNDATAQKIGGSSFSSWKSFKAAISSSSEGESLGNFDQVQFMCTLKNWIKLEDEAVSSLLKAHCYNEYSSATDILHFLKTHSPFE